MILRNTGRELSFLAATQLKPGDYSVEVRVRDGSKNCGVAAWSRP